MLLENKTAILYGGRGHIGATVARVFAREGGTGLSHRAYTRPA